MDQCLEQANHGPDQPNQTYALDRLEAHPASIRLAKRSEPPLFAQQVEHMQTTCLKFDQLDQLRRRAAQLLGGSLDIALVHLDHVQSFGQQGWKILMHRVDCDTLSMAAALPQFAGRCISFAMLSDP